ncbi:hypothetical protein [Foetidibacter luteolus]|uniref:hypothetical protein n=1 Tax=Foetidibacter luteolus TaxID=2608880 RepID=UPI00129A661E|nr:hypothetical protein [Foetidibacter luteolus]
MLLLFCTAMGQSHGLQFLSHEVVQEKRTSLNLTPSEPFCIKENTEISFDISFSPDMETYFGYVVRIVTKDNQNIDIVYNQRLLNFNFVIGENFSVVFTVEQARLYGQWNNFKIQFAGPAKDPCFYLNNKLIARGKLKPGSNACSRICFGASDLAGFQTVDIPPMRIKDIRINDAGKPVYFYPLSESTGLQATDDIRNQAAIVKNPVWIKPRHQNWQAVNNFATRGSASIAFNARTETLYVITEDTLYKLAVKNMQLASTPLSARHDSLLPGNQSLYSTFTNKLYNFYIDQQKVSIYDTTNRRWTQNFTPALLTEFWHANKFFSTLDTSLYIFGGYGQLHYKNQLQRYAVNTGKWETVITSGGEVSPRYLAAVGLNAQGDTAYILGGYGSKTGDQTINPRYNYELAAYDIKRKTYSHILQLQEPALQFCFANSLIIDSATRNYYALTYPIDRFNSSLQLIKGSLHSPVYEIMADSIPYPYHDIESYADLFYCPVSKKLVAVTLFSARHSSTEVKVYTLDFPPNIPETAKQATNGMPGYWPYALAALLVVSAGASYYYMRRKKAIVAQAPRQVATAYVPPAESIATAPAQQTPVYAAGEKKQEALLQLFGGFEAFDKSGTNITKQFTPLLKELFLLILVYSYREARGITAEKLYEILWHDKPLKDAKNNFSVNVVKLKTILEKVGECHIGKESGKWKFEVTNDSIYTDYQEYMSLIGNISATDKAAIMRLADIVGKGAFLTELHYNWLDDIKADISSQVIDKLLGYIVTADTAAEAEFIIRLCNCIFLFDQLNEDALKYKCRSLVTLGRHGMAKEAWLKFSKEYRENYGEEVTTSFKEITGVE